MEKESDLLQKYDIQRIKSLELQGLRNLSPQYEEKHREVSAETEKLEREVNKIKQSLVTSQVKIDELRKSLNKNKLIYQELCSRANRVEQELTKINVTSPIYKYKINQSLRTFEEKFNEPQEIAIRTDWSTLEKELQEENHNLEEKIQECQTLLDDFADDYIK
ncbi:uncharacterized protein LOC126743219 [Anthonomus grandis grandis]|uniref:uncharacterized protein LOC126743219 n=1 Tax=Anthonomus grandis grandis TaxID=2921223 RepID=UPI0021667BB6|nr:uncharacterized protein LOC126743219 [Anthonomus grandis grandis]